MIPHQGFRCIITLDLETVPNIEQYMITIGSFPDHSYPYFKGILALLLITISKSCYPLEVPIPKTFLVVC
jgi:hypothetical protein